MATTLADLVTYCQRHGWRGTETADTTQLKVWINDVLAWLSTARRWPWYEKTGWLNLTAPYEAGTVALTLAGTGVVGTTTTFAAGMAGQEFYTAEDSGRIYDVASFTDETHITLSSAYLGATASGKTYQVRYTRYSAPSDWGQEGTFLFQDGRELNYSRMTLPEFRRERLATRSTSATPRFLLHHNLAGTDYFYVDAPSAAAQITYTYWKRADSLSGDTVTTDWPDKARRVLHAALRVAMSDDDAEAGLTALRQGALDDVMDDFFRAECRQGPIPVNLAGSGRRGDRIGLNGLGAMLNVTD